MSTTEATALFLAGAAAALVVVRWGLRAAKRNGWSWPPSSRRKDRDE